MISGTRSGKTYLTDALMREFEKRDMRVLLVTSKGFRYSDVPEGTIIQGEIVKEVLEIDS